MKIMSSQSFRAKLSKMTSKVHSVGALDIGTKHIGVACCHLPTLSISPLERITIPLLDVNLSASYSKYRTDNVNFDKLGVRLQKIVDEQGMAGLVVGFPLSKDQQLTPMCTFILNLVNRTKLLSPARSEELGVAFWDERESTMRARELARLLSPQRHTTLIKRDKDSLSASLILQGWIEGGLK